MVMHWIIHEWIARLMLLRERLREHFAAGSVAGGERESDAWYLIIRARILAFLVQRYRELPMETEVRGQSATESERVGEMPTFCAVLPEDAPPRKREDLGRLLRSIRARNEASRPRWRWWI